MAAFLKEAARPGELCIVQTESGDPATDAKLKASSAFPVMDMTRGCVGCTSLAASVLSLLDDLSSSHSPRILVETSSISHKTIKSIIGDSFPGEDPPFSVLVVDPELWVSQYENSKALAESMVLLADHITLNPKVPYGVATELQDKINALKDDFKLLNPSCPADAFSLKEATPEDLDAVLGFFGFPSYDEVVG
jgi:G3E family GTPase